MPASNSEARKRHEEAVAATTDAMAEALSNMAYEEAHVKPKVVGLHSGRWAASCPACIAQANRR